MRKLLFRGQTRRKGEKVRMNGEPVSSNWVYGGIFHQNDRGGDYSIIYTYDPIEKYVVYADTVGQFIGENDKNEVPIFEGDIVKSDTYQAIGQVVYEGGHFWVKDLVDGIQYVEPNDWQEFIVVGNIYDNSYADEWYKL